MAKDTISRQAAIDAAKRTDYRGLTVEDVKKVTDAVVEELKALPPAQPEQRWIPCSERLPKEKDAGILKKLGINTRSDIVLVTVRVKEDLITDHARTNSGIWHWELKYAFPDHEVVAWMPLPEPYKVGEKDG